MKPEATHVWVPADGHDAKNGIANGFQGKAPMMQKGGSTLTIHDGNYAVQVKEKTCGCGTKDKQILKNVRYIVHVNFVCKSTK